MVFSSPLGLLVERMTFHTSEQNAFRRCYPDSRRNHRSDQRRHEEPHRHDVGTRKFSS
ncbi:hypothetical protein PLICRDRAFT_56849 [Plicaturopsis crispa FD-325 SS-3]|nr:hypothetical protein PLICRDRAFT_56849 [Plicaturopsis crispa FD-325 SS-3]